MRQMKKALCIGMEYEGTEAQLFGCINDAKKLAEILKRNEDETPNFNVKILTDKETRITKQSLESSIQDLCSENSEVMDLILFYYSGHGSNSEDGGVFVTSDFKETHGLKMSYLLNAIIHSKAKNKIIILDCCFAGQMANPYSKSFDSYLPPGTTILTACKENEVSYISEKGQSVFTELLFYALKGEAKNIFGEISASSIYSYIDSSLREWDQRPIFKTNISQSVILRNTLPLIDISILRKLTDYFPKLNDKYSLDPTFEPNIDKDVDLSKFPHIPQDIKPDHAKNLIFREFQNLNRLGLLKPTQKNDMFYAAIWSDTCELTPIGQYYWRLAEKEKI